jgi:hypothetical protein
MIQGGVDMAAGSRGLQGGIKRADRYVWVEGGKEAERRRQWPQRLGFLYFVDVRLGIFVILGIEAGACVDLFRV